MSNAITAKALIERPTEVVWSVLTDWSQAPKWMSGVEAISADGELVAGTELTFRARGKDRPSQIVSLEPGRSLTLRSAQGGVTADYTYTLSPVTDGTTEASLVADCRTDGVLWNAAGPLLRIMMRRTDGDQMAELKELVERTA